MVESPQRTYSTGAMVPAILPSTEIRRVLLVNDFADGGGAEVVVRQLCDGLNGRGIETRVATADSLGATRSPISYVYNRRARQALRRVVAEFRPDVVNVHNYYHHLSPAILGAIEPPTALVLTLHDYHLACPNVGLERFTRSSRVALSPEDLPLGPTSLLRYRWDHRGWAHSGLRVAQHVVGYRLLKLHRRPDCLVSPSATAATILARAGFDVGVVPNPVMVAPQWERRLPSQMLKIALVGRVEPEKGFAAFLGQLAEIGTECEVHIVGDGSELDACTAAAAPLGNRAIFHGRVSHTSAIEILRSCQILALPSVWYETDPLVLVEGLANGCWLLCASRGGGKDTAINSGAGEVYDPWSVDSLRAALDRLAVNAISLPDERAVRAYLDTRSLDLHLDGVLAEFGNAARRARGEAG
jgi:glycosyltransferase involved in cell wall biosynthesis